MAESCCQSGPMVTVGGQSYTLDQYARLLEQCRNLVDGITVRNIIVGAEAFAGLTTLIQQATGTTPNGFCLRHTATLGAYATWREMTISPERPAPASPGTLDMTALPLRYTNQAGTIMEFWPPWAAQDGADPAWRKRHALPRQRGARKRTSPTRRLQRKEGV